MLYPRHQFLQSNQSEWSTLVIGPLLLSKLEFNSNNFAQFSSAQNEQSHFNNRYYLKRLITRWPYKTDFKNSPPLLPSSSLLLVSSPKIRSALKSAHPRRLRGSTFGSLRQYWPCPVHLLAPFWSQLNSVEQCISLPPSRKSPLLLLRTYSTKVNCHVESPLSCIWLNVRPTSLCWRSLPPFHRTRLHTFRHCLRCC